MTATAPAKPAPSPFGALCDAPTRDGRCGRIAWRTYTDTEGVERGFCVQATCAWRTMERYPAAPDARQRTVR